MKHQRPTWLDDIVRVATWILPLAMILAIVESIPTRNTAPPPDTAAIERHDAKLVLVIIDSLRPQNVTPELMPHLSRRVAAGEFVKRPLRTCEANFTLPCIQTLLEGRESPFVAGLDNFTGARGGANSLPALIQATGRESVMISNHTLKSLYGDTARTTYDVQEWGGSHLERDLRSFEVASEEWSRGTADFLVLHVLGTDKVSHRKRPGAKPYIDHFGKVDAALDRFLDELSPETYVVVTGDHGHEAMGHHTRNSVVLFGGAEYPRLLANAPEGLAQKDLLFFLSYPFAFPLPVGADAKFPAWAAASATTSYEAMAQNQLRALGRSEGDAARELEGARDAIRANRSDPILAALPLWALAIIFLTRFWRHQTAPVHERRWTGVLVALGLGGFSLAHFASPALGPVLAAIILGVHGWLGLRRGWLRETAILGVLLAIAAGLSAGAEAWTDLFHIRQGIRPSWFGFYALMIAAGVAIGASLFRTKWLSLEGALVWTLTILPSGVYYYQFGQNQFSPLLFLGIPTLIAVLVFRRRGELDRPTLSPPSRVAALTVALLGVVPMLQTAGGWEWHFRPSQWLSKAPIAAWLIAIVAACVGTFLMKGARRRIFYLSAWVLFPLYSVLFAGLDLERMTSATLIVLIPIAWSAFASRPDGLRPIDERAADISIAIIAWAGMLHATWLLVDGFLLTNVDFSFALELFQDLKRERDAYILTQLATNLKYGIPFILIVIGLFGTLERARFKRVIGIIMVFAYFKALALIAQASFGAAFQTQRLWELSIADLLFVMNIIVTVPLVALPLFMTTGSTRDAPESPAR